MNTGDYESYMENQTFLDFDEYRILPPENQSISAFLKNNPDYDIFCINNIRHQLLAGCELSSLNNDEIHKQTKPNEQKVSKRVKNTIFKTSASQFRKSISEYIRNNSSLAWIQRRLEQTSRVKNLSLFPKLLAIVKQLNINSQIAQIWKRKSSKILEKKRKRMDEGKFCSLRFKQLQNSINTMNKCMNETDFIKSFDIYWGIYKHIDKYEKSKREVLHYQEQLKKLKFKHERIIQIQKKFRERMKEETLSSKNPQELKFLNQQMNFSQEDYKQWLSLKLKYDCQ